MIVARHEVPGLQIGRFEKVAPGKFRAFCGPRGQKKFSQGL
jgi:hypothetical protein